MHTCNALWAFYLPTFFLAGEGGGGNRCDVFIQENLAIPKYPKISEGVSNNSQSQSRICFVKQNPGATACNFFSSYIREYEKVHYHLTILSYLHWFKVMYLLRLGQVALFFS